MFVYQLLGGYVTYRNRFSCRPHPVLRIISHLRSDSSLGSVVKFNFIMVDSLGNTFVVGQQMAYGGINQRTCLKERVKEFKYLYLI